MDKKLLEEIKEYIVEMEVCVDGEWGRCREAEQLIADGEMPELYKKVCKEIGKEERAEEEYNGWKNFATWKVNLEMFNGSRPEDINAEGKEATADEVRKHAELYLADESGQELAQGYALNFLANVDWQEIADAINE